MYSFRPVDRGARGVTLMSRGELSLHYKLVGMSSVSCSDVRSKIVFVVFVTVVFCQAE